jgi:protein involved in polysaccharide export with SLBB domain
VTVAGAVVKPGRYPYIPDREWDYYIALAGGFVPDRNLAESVIIVDIGGKRLKKMDTITPETIITARTNHALYFFNQYAPVITTLASIITTVISVTALINR